MRKEVNTNLIANSQNVQYSLICDGSINKQQLAGVSFSNFRGGQFFDSNQQGPPWLFNGNSPPSLGPGAMNLQHLQSVEEVVSEEWIIYMICRDLMIFQGWIHILKICLKKHAKLRHSVTHVCPFKSELYILSTRLRFTSAYFVDLCGLWKLLSRTQASILYTGLQYKITGRGVAYSNKNPLWSFQAWWAKCWVFAIIGRLDQWFLNRRSLQVHFLKT